VRNLRTNSAKKEIGPKVIRIKASASFPGFIAVPEATGQKIGKKSKK
jgi:hypothetical protein